MPTRIRKDFFLQSVALPRAGQNPCQRRKMTVSTNNGLVNGPVHNLLMQFFTLDSSKIELFETYFFDTVIPPRMQGLYSNSALFWAPEKAGLRQPLLIFSPLLGTPENAGVMLQLRPFLGPQEGMGEVATSDFLPALGVGTPRMQGLHINSALFWPPEKVGVRQPLLTFSPRLALGIPKNTGVM